MVPAAYHTIPYNTIITNCYMGESMALYLAICIWSDGYKWNGSIKQGLGGGGGALGACMYVDNAHTYL